MNNLSRTRKLFYLTICATLLQPQARPQSTPIHEPVIGTWTLVSTEEKLRDGRTRPYPDLGKNAKGFLMYSADGHMCAKS